MITIRLRSAYYALLIIPLHDYNIIPFQLSVLPWGYVEGRTTYVNLSHILHCPRIQSAMGTISYMYTAKPSPHRKRLQA